MATVVKNFRIKSGLVVEGSTGTINGQNILTETGGDSYILNLVGGAALVKSVDSGTFAVDGAGNLTVKANVFDAYGSASSAQAAAISTAASDATTKADAAQSAATTAAASDATTKADAAQAAAISTAASDATTKANAAQSAATTAAASDATTKADAAQAAAESTAASALSSAISTEVSNRNTAISTAVDGLVDGAPDLLNTLNELAAAINDDANYTTTITTALGTKAPLASPDLTGTPTAPTAAADTNTTQIATTAFAKAEADAAQSAAEATAASDATTKADAAQAAAISTAASDATTKASAAQSAATTAAASDATTKADAAQAAAEATAAAANTAQQNGTTAFTAINYNSVAKQVAATTGNIETAAATTALSWVAADYRSAKLVVKAKNGSHTQISDLVVTLDTSNNVAVSEYGITYSNGTELAAVTADYSGSDVRIRVTPANNNTEVVVVGTLIK